MSEPVAIVGMSVLLPGADSLEDYWRNLVAGTDSITDVPENRWQSHYYDPERAGHPSRLYCRRGGFVDESAYFDPLPFGIMPGSVLEIEQDQLLALRVAAAAIEDAGGTDRLPDRDRVGVVLGRLGLAGMASMKFYARVMSGDQITRFIKELVPDIGDDQLNRVRTRIDERLGPFHPENVIGLMSNLAASRIANRLNLRGTSYTLDAACASSLIAVDHAVRELTSGRLDAVIAGGTHHNHDVSFWAVFTQIGALSRKQRIRPFHADADGLLLGEGSGMVVLKRLSDALRDDDRIYAVIRGVGVAGDGRSASLVSPETAGQVLAIRRAWEAAGLDPAAPDALGLLEAHGTATAVGDAAEVATMGTVFGPPQPGSAPVIGSVKSQIGHTLAAAGVAGLVKAALAVSRGVLLPTLHCDDPRPELESTRFRPIPSARPWESTGPRRAAVNAFGFGGINAHVILEQAPEPPRPRVTGPAAPVGAVTVTEPEQVLLLAGQDSVAITRLLDADDHAVRASGIPAASGTEAECRLGVVGPTAARLAAARKIVAAGNPWHGGRDIWFSPSPLLGAGGGKTAFVFPGLEADFTPQLADVIARFGIETRELDEQEYSGHLAAVIQVGWILHRALEHIGVTPDAVAGHSLGEWTAGIVAGLADESTLDEQAKTLLNPVAIRDDLMHAVISESAENVTATLADYPEIFLSHDNAPSQAVVCGPAAQVELLITEYGKRNVVCRGLPYATGVHTPYLEPFVRELREFDDRQAPLSARFPVWSGVTAAPLPADPEQRRELFFRQLTEPIQFTWRCR
jgi:acyl transferase domain-containing protein